MDRVLDLGVAAPPWVATRRRGVVGPVRAVAVVVVPPPGLAAEATGGHHPRLDRVRLPARLVKALLPERLRDLEVDVDAHQVHELERAHAEAAADPHDPVDLIVRGDPVAQQAQRLERERARHAVGHEADRVGGADRLAAHRLGHLAGDRQRLLGGLVAGDHLHQAHQRRRVEEVHAADALGPLHPGGDRGHRERGGVGGQDRLGSADAGELREQLALQLQVLGSSLDHQLAAGQVLQPRRCAKAGRCGLGLGLRPPAAVGSLHQRRAKPSARPRAAPSGTGSCR